MLKAFLLLLVTCLLLLLDTCLLSSESWFKDRKIYLWWCSFCMALISPWEQTFSSGSGLELNLGVSPRAHNWNLILPLLLLPEDRVQEVWLQGSHFSVIVGNYLNNTKSPECQLRDCQLLVALVLWSSSEEKPLGISVFPFLCSPASLAWVLAAIPTRSSRYWMGFFSVPEHHCSSTRSVLLSLWFSHLRRITLLNTSPQCLELPSPQSWSSSLLLRTKPYSLHNPLASRHHLQNQTWSLFTNHSGIPRNTVL